METYNGYKHPLGLQWRGGYCYDPDIEDATNQSECESITNGVWIPNSEGVSGLVSDGICIQTVGAGQKETPTTCLQNGYK